MTDLAAVSAGVGTLALAAIAAAGLRQTGHAVRDGYRTRVDQAAPRLALITHGVQQSGGFRIGDNSDVSSRVERWEGFSVDLAGEPARPLYVRVWAELRNDGRSTAFVTLPPRVCPVDADGRDPLLPGAGSRWNAGAGQPLTLAPGQQQWLFVEAEFTVAEAVHLDKRFHGDIRAVEAAVERGDTSAGRLFTIDSGDQYADGVRDSLRLVISALPLEAVPAGSTTQRLRSPVPATVRVLRTQRQYASERAKSTSTA